MIYIVAHKQFKMPLLKGEYKTIYVGSNIKKWAMENSQLHDSDGDKNIAGKNPNYCELTALYWMYKNDVSSKNIGLNHYRRYFKSDLDTSIASTKELDSYLEKYDVVLVKRIKFLISIEQNYYMTTGYKQDISLLRKVIKSIYPEYLSTLNRFLKGKSMSYANMFYMSNERFKRYSEWLYDILFEMEKMVDMSGYTLQEKRLYGYLGELLLNVWVMNNNLKVKELDLVNLDVQSTHPLIYLKNRIIQESKYIAKYILYFPSGIPTRRRK